MLGLHSRPLVVHRGRQQGRSFQVVSRLHLVLPVELSQVVSGQLLALQLALVAEVAVWLAHHLSLALALGVSRVNYPPTASTL